MLYHSFNKSYRWLGFCFVMTCELWDLSGVDRCVHRDCSEFLETSEILLKDRGNHIQNIHRQDPEAPWCKRFYR